MVSILGLKRKDVRTIHNTLDSYLPFSSTQKRAQEPATGEDFREFCLTLSEELMPWAEPLGSALAVAPLPLLDVAAPWVILMVSAAGDRQSGQLSDTAGPWEEIIRLADQMAASEIIKPDQANQTVWIARLKQRRYWTSSQARLLAERIVWKHLDDLLGDRAA